jgi:hypothetical protein
LKVYKGAVYWQHLILGILPTGNDTRPFGLCCFNGCANKCLKKPCVLDTAVVTECNPVMEPHCKEIEVRDFQEIIDILLPKLF